MAKTRIKIFGTAALFLFWAGISGGYAEGEIDRGDLSLVNTVSLSLGGVENLVLDLADDEVIIRESKTGELVVREYMKRDRPQYYANVSRIGETLSVRRGRRPWLSWSWKARIEIDLPRSFRENIRISNGSGLLRAEMDFLDFRTIDLSVGSGVTVFKDLSGETVSVRVASGSLDTASIEGNSFISISSGRLQIGALTGTEHRIKCSSGITRIGPIRGDSAIDISSGRIAVESIEGDTVVDISSGNLQITDLTGMNHRFKGSSGTSVIEKARGRIESQISSGSFTIGDFSGEGSFTISSGNIDLDTRELSGDLRFTVSSGNINLALPRDLSFNLDAVTNSGRILVEDDRDGVVQVSGNSTILRPFGPSPARTIYARTTSGLVTIKRD